MDEFCLGGAYLTTARGTKPLTSTQNMSQICDLWTAALQVSTETVPKKVATSGRRRLLTVAPPAFGATVRGNKS